MDLCVYRGWRILSYDSEMRSSRSERKEDGLFIFIFFILIKCEEGQLGKEIRAQPREVGYYETVMEMNC